MYFSTCISDLELSFISMSHLIYSIRNGWQWHIRCIRSFQQNMTRSYIWYITVIHNSFTIIYQFVLLRHIDREAMFCVLSPDTASTQGMTRPLTMGVWAHTWSRAWNGGTRLSACSLGNMLLSEVLRSKLEPHDHRQTSWEWWIVGFRDISISIMQCFVMVLIKWTQSKCLYWCRMIPSHPTNNIPNFAYGARPIWYC